MKHESHAAAVSQQLNRRDFWVVTVNAFHRTGDLKLQRDPLNPRRLTQYNGSSWGSRFLRPKGASPISRCIIWQGNVKKGFSRCESMKYHIARAPALPFSLANPVEEEGMLCIRSWWLASVMLHLVTGFIVTLARLMFICGQFNEFLHHCCCSLLVAHVSVHVESTRTCRPPPRPSAALQTVDF